MDEEDRKVVMDQLTEAKMDEEDRKVVMDQLTSYDRFMSAVTVASLNRTLAVVAVPPKPPILRRNGWQLMH